MTYRDHLLTCPRCGATLGREKRQEVWSCPACRGVAVETGELIRLLLRYAPDLMPDGGARGLVIAPRTATTPLLRCAACTRAMDRVLLHGVALERCTHDDLLWFEANELEDVIGAAIADVEARKGWGQRLRDLLFAN